jgi:hypothetical protein
MMKQYGLYYAVLRNCSTLNVYVYRVSISSYQMSSCGLFVLWWALECCMPCLIASKARTCRWAAKNLQEQQDAAIPPYRLLIFAGKRRVCLQDPKALARRKKQAFFSSLGAAVKEVGIQPRMGYSCETHQHVGISRTPSHTPADESAALLCASGGRNFVSRSAAAAQPAINAGRIQFFAVIPVASLLLPNLNNQPVSNSLRKRRRCCRFVLYASRIYWGHMLWKPSGVLASRLLLTWLHPNANWNFVKINTLFVAKSVKLQNYVDWTIFPSCVFYFWKYQIKRHKAEKEWIH